MTFEASLRPHIGAPGEKVFSSQSGLPGYHAELRAANDVMWNTSTTFNAWVQVGTVRWQDSGDLKAGGYMPACLNCSPILPPVQFDVFADKKIND